MILPEFERFLNKLDLDGEELSEGLFSAFDQDSNLELDWGEVQIGMCLLMAGSYEERLEAVFLFMDKDGSGELSSKACSLNPKP